MTADARPSCMIAALDTLKAANKLKTDRKGRVVEPLPELYWSLIAEAQIFADLARAGLDVGLIAGTHITDRDDRIREARDRGVEAVKRAKTRRDAEVQDQPRTYADGSTAADHNGHGCSADPLKHQDRPKSSTTPPFAEGHRVRIVAKTFAGSTIDGRLGTVVDVIDADKLMVEIDVAAIGAPPMVLALTPVDVELVDQ